MYEQVYRPPPLPAQFHDASLRLPCRPRVIHPFEPPCQPYTMDPGSIIRQPFFMPQVAEPRHLQPPSSELNAPVVSTGFEAIVARSSSESVFSQQSSVDEAAVCERVEMRSDCNRNVDMMSQKSSDSVRPSTNVSVNNKERSESDRQQQRKTSTQSVRSRRTDHDLHRDTHKDTSKPRRSTLDNRL